MRSWARRAVTVGALVGIAVTVVTLWRRRAARAAGTGRAPAAPAPPVPVPSRREPVATNPAPGGASDSACIDPDDAGNCPVSHPIKGKVRTGIFHPPGAFAYDRTHADRCYRDAAAAEADGLRAAKR